MSTGKKPRKNRNLKNIPFAHRMQMIYAVADHTYSTANDVKEPSQLKHYEKSFNRKYTFYKASDNTSKKIATCFSQDVRRFRNALVSKYICTQKSNPTRKTVEIHFIKDQKPSSRPKPTKSKKNVTINTKAPQNSKDEKYMNAVEAVIAKDFDRTYSQDVNAKQIYFDKNGSALPFSFPQYSLIVQQSKTQLYIIVEMDPVKTDDTTAKITINMLPKSEKQFLDTLSDNSDRIGRNKTSHFSFDKTNKSTNIYSSNSPFETPINYNKKNVRWKISNNQTMLFEQKNDWITDSGKKKKIFGHVFG
eukprot:35790_1